MALFNFEDKIGLDSSNMTEQGFYDNLMVTNNQTGRNDVGVKCPEPVDRDVNNIQTELQNTITGRISPENSCHP